MEAVRCGPCGAVDAYDTTGVNQVTCRGCGVRLALYPGVNPGELDGRPVGGAYRATGGEGAP